MAKTLRSYFRSNKIVLHIGESGKWRKLTDVDNDEMRSCSLCGFFGMEYYNFCPLCGGDMRELKETKGDN